ncbi:hypothetical protein A2886_02390 [candidate division WWE3 bacterium RIFCSPHIGHO2_01_FULL_42_13]|uniref:General secretion pathway GspH domain-containing protein n=1 Tax=candidate division WWE3 bacterium RIFCSPHIGHO2_01_FULL_42_13 TaxID=1802617 RepID=A0A1F4UTU1_UNCKA|nr:MAG: hypothetical protein A2886_02390 [candidate division WWE3 bacterium RIFCSPHIGHO2_01_FULL_42_13]
MNNRGFTLVELLLVVSLIAVLSSFLIPGFSNYIDNQNIRQAQEIVKSDLRTVQNNALSGVGSSSSSVLYWGLKISSQNASNYGFFKAAAANSSACSSATIEQTSVDLPGAVVIRDGAGACVFFNLRNGDATVVNLPNSTIKLGPAGVTACDGVQINSAGMIRGVEIC